MSSDSMDDVVGTSEAARRYVEQMPMGMTTYQGPDLVFVLANQSYRSSYGRPDLIGKPVREAFPEAAGQGLFEQMERVRATGEPVRIDAMRAELEVDGTGAVTEHFLDMWMVPAVDADGSITGIHAHTVDVTDRVQAQHRAEEQAREAQQRYADALTVVRTLQDALLPVELPVLPRVDIAARYLLASHDEAAGGDWFDAVVRPDGTVALVVGDVVGHGVTASAVMGQLRAVLHDHLLGDEALEVALGSLDRFARVTEGASYATVCVVLLDPVTGDMTYCTAGHPPPVVASAAGSARFVETTGSGPLASGTGYTTRTMTLGEDETVVLYSDGLVERPGRAPAESTVEILQVVGDRVAGKGFPSGVGTRLAERLCQESLEVLTRSTGHADDITVVAALRLPPRLGHHASWPVDDSSDRRAREGLDEWLSAYAPPTHVRVAIAHALSELVANSVRHAYRDRAPGSVDVDADLDAHGCLEVTVTDHGTWHPEQPGSDSRGLAMVRGLVDELELVHGDPGTRATVRLRLGREARLVSRASGDSNGLPDVGTPFGVTSKDGIVAVRGAVDLTGAAQLQSALRSVRVADGALVLDLAGVTHLGSAGVRVLHEAASPNGTPGLRLVAPNGSVAQHVLELVQLAYDTGSPG